MFVCSKTAILNQKNVSPRITYQRAEMNQKRRTLPTSQPYPSDQSIERNMGKEQIATILPTIEEVYDASLSDAIYCATFTTSSGSAPTIQLIPQTLNICEWTFQKNPENEIKSLLGKLLPNLRLNDWAADSHAIFDFGSVSLINQAQAIDLLFLLYLRSHHHYQLHVEEIYPVG